MAGKQEQIVQGPSLLLYGRFGQWAAVCVVVVGYLFSLFLVQRILLSFLLLTGIYGAWLLVYYFGKERSHPWYMLALFCLACASLFIPLPATSAYWLPVLPSTTACLLAAARLRRPGVLAAGGLWLATSLALGLVSGSWDIGGQVILLISFVSICGCSVTIRELAVAHRQLSEYSAQVEELSVIRERNRIAREIHDTLGHALTLLSVQLETAMQLEARGDPRLREELLAARQVTKACLTDVRHSVEALRPDEAAADSLQERLRKLVAEFATTCRQAQITLDLEEATHPLHPELSQTLYRCAQEALTNIRKHAQATKVLLRLSTSNGDGQVELTVLDNGQGGELAYEQRSAGFGLLGMGERVALLGGRCQAGPQPRHGWRVEVLLPLMPQEQTHGNETHTGESCESKETVER